MELAIRNNSFIWHLLNGLCIEQKMDLITKLSCSVSESLAAPALKPRPSESNPIASSFGAWKVSEKDYPTEELLSDINTMMTDSNDFISQFVRDTNDEEK